MVNNLPASAGDIHSIPGSGRSPGRENGNTSSVILPGKSYAQRNLADYSPLDCKRVRHDLVTKQQQLKQQTANQTINWNKCKHTHQFSSVLQSCPTLCNPMNHSLPGSSVHEILQARILEWAAISF